MQAFRSDPLAHVVHSFRRTATDPDAGGTNARASSVPRGSLVLLDNVPRIGCTMFGVAIP